MTSASQNKTWFSVEIGSTREATEAVEFALLESGALGTEISMPAKDKDAPLQTPQTVVGYFNERVDLQNKLSEALEIYSLPPDAVRSVRWQKVEQRDWLEEWKKSWKPVESGRFIVAPTWSEIPDSPDKIVIRIEPGMAFGTGMHETTRLCLEAIGDKYRGGSFLDVGTGTAVLAIAAAKMFPPSEPSGPSGAAAKIEACDNDPDAVAIARENAALNGAADSIKFYDGSITSDTKVFDFICANLTADVIIPLLSHLVEKSRETLVLSGILAEQKELITGNLKELGQKDFSIDRSGEWVSITVDRKQTSI